jgi:hypothetical protein
VFKSEHGASFTTAGLAWMVEHAGKAAELGFGLTRTATTTQAEITRQRPTVAAWRAMRRCMLL